MAPAAGGGNVAMIDRRLGIIRRQYLVRASVAVLAVGCHRAGLRRLGMKTVRVSRLFVCMAIDTSRRPPQVLVRRIIRGLVAIHAGKQIAVDRVFQFFFIDIQADRPAVHLPGHRGVGMAGKAVLIGCLVLGVSRDGANEQRQGKRLNEELSGRGHEFEEILLNEFRQ
jgi:hypothetical protein